MKTKEDIQNEISKLKDDFKNFKPNEKSKVDPDKQRNKFKKKIDTRVSFLRKVILYVETNPRESFLDKELGKINSGLQKIADQVTELKRLRNPKEAIAEVKKEGRYNLLVSQKKYIQYILQ